MLLFYFCFVVICILIHGFAKYTLSSLNQLIIVNVLLQMLYRKNNVRADNIAIKNVTHVHVISSTSKCHFVF